MNFFHHPEITLYLALAAVYFTFALQSRCDGHLSASRLYGFSGIIHAGLALCHWLG
jgi:hypothetical protein